MGTRLKLDYAEAPALKSSASDAKPDAAGMKSKGPPLRATLLHFCLAPAPGPNPGIKLKAGADTLRVSGIQETPQHPAP